MNKAILDTDKHDLLHRFNSIYLSLNCARDAINFKKDPDKAMHYIEEAIKKIDTFAEEIIKGAVYE